MAHNKPLFASLAGIAFVLALLGYALFAAPNGEDSPVASASSSGREATALELHDQAMELAATAWHKAENEKAELLRQAIDLLTEAIEKEPDFASAYTNRGSFYHSIGEPELALADFERAISIRPAAIAYKNKAHVLESQGRLEAALESYEWALSSFGISTETFVSAASNMQDTRAALRDHKRAGADILYTPSVVSTIEEVLELRSRLGRPINGELAAPESRL